MQLCGQLTNACPTMDAKFYAGSQVIDEVRHVEVLSKFLQRKMGTLHPIDPTLKVLLDMLLEAPTWKMKTLGMQCLFEGMAVGIFDQIARATTNPLLRDIIRRVQIDESRHAAFGILTMRQVVKESTPEEMEEMEDFAFSILEALNANQQLDMLRLLGPKYGLDPDNVVQMTLWHAGVAGDQQRDLHAHRRAEPEAPRPDHRAHRSRLAPPRHDPRRAGVVQSPKRRRSPAHGARRFRRHRSVVEFRSPSRRERATRSRAVARRDAGLASSSARLHVRPRWHCARPPTRCRHG